MAAIALVAIAAGCSKADSPEPADAPAPAIAMQGSVLPSIVGTWTYDQGTFSFTKEGDYDVHYDYMRAGGPGQPQSHIVGDDKGTWTADEKYVYMKSAKGNVIRDDYKLASDGSTLDLYPKYIKVPEVLRRKKT